MAHNYMPAAMPASFPADEAFLDRLETYFDFRDAPADDFSSVALENIARELVQVAGALRKVAGVVTDEGHRIMIAKIAGEDSRPVIDWRAAGYGLQEGARLVAQAVKQKFGFDREGVAG